LLSTSHTERNFPFFGARIVAKIERKQQDRRNNKKTESNNIEEIIKSRKSILFLLDTVLVHRFLKSQREKILLLKKEQIG